MLCFVPASAAERLFRWNVTVVAARQRVDGDVPKSQCAPACGDGARVFDEQLAREVDDGPLGGAADDADIERQLGLLVTCRGVWRRQRADACGGCPAAACALRVCAHMEWGGAAGRDGRSILGASLRWRLKVNDTVMLHV